LVIFDTSWLCLIVHHRRLFSVALVSVVIVVRRLVIVMINMSLRIFLILMLVDILMLTVVVNWLFLLIRLVNIIVVVVVVDWLFFIVLKITVDWNLFWIVVMVTVLVMVMRLVMGLVRGFVMGLMMGFFMVSTFIVIESINWLVMLDCIDRLVMLPFSLSLMVFLREVIRLSGNYIMITIWLLVLRLSLSGH